MKKTVLTLALLLCSSFAFSQNECTALGLQTLTQAADSLGTVHQIFCWSSVTAKVSIPAAVNNIVAFPLLANPIGTVGSPAYSFTGFTNTGIFLGASCCVEISQAGQLVAVFGSNLQLLNNTHLALNSSKGQHIDYFAANGDGSGVATCSASSVTVTFTSAYTSTPTIVVSDETAAGGARVSAKSNTSFTITCTGATDVVDYMTVGNPN